MGIKKDEVSILKGRKNIIKYLMDTKGVCLIYSEDKICYDFIKVIFPDDTCFGFNMVSYDINKLIPISDMGIEIDSIEA